MQVSAGDHGVADRDGAPARPRRREPHEDAAIGNGPVDALYKAIDARSTHLQNELTEFSVKAVTEGIDAQGEVTVRIEADGGRPRRPRRRTRTSSWPARGPTCTRSTGYRAASVAAAADGRAVTD